MMAPFMLSSYTKYVTTHREEENLYASTDKQELTDSARWWWAKPQSHGKYVSIMCTETRTHLSGSHREEQWRLSEVLKAKRGENGSIGQYMHRKSEKGHEMMTLKRDWK